MNLANVRDTADYYSGKASEITRQLAFAGLAVIWIFRTDEASLHLVPHELVLPTISIVRALASDLLQYVTAHAVWAGYNRWYEIRGRSQDEEFTVPPKINWTTNFFYIMKIALLVAAYVSLSKYLAHFL